VTPEAAEKLEKFFGGLAGNTSPLLLLDYDGTLAPFRVDRFRSRPWAGVRELLQRIHRQGRTRMAVITGRPAVEIAPMLGLDPPLEVWGLHGAEHLYPDGGRELEQAPGATLEKLNELKEHLRHDSLGGLFEDKANGAVMHWRGASARKARLIERRTRALFEPLAKLDGLKLLDFEAGLELRAGRNKGGAVEAIIAETGAHGPVAYLGDDLSDEAAFQVVNGLDSSGLSVLVRRRHRQSEAHIWLRPPEELRTFLKRWIEACSPSLEDSRDLTTNHCFSTLCPSSESRY
jgi:trehalose 6-phosphate synthase/trehalose 6-phosphate phosphatase